MHFFSIGVVESALAEFAAEGDNFPLVVLDLLDVVVSHWLDVFLLWKPGDGDLLLEANWRGLYLHLWLYPVRPNKRYLWYGGLLDWLVGGRLGQQPTFLCFFLLQAFIRKLYN